ncbi:MAG TPA: hypothetical protein VJ307_01575 [Candidatus Deferrimicrobiaceae bacterium]|jgi:hypothetical protein|nr:hypothetical protein [Candidatus Deferrimicrobiaceae bacterium]
MKRVRQGILLSAVAVGISLIAAVCRHSVEEIHYRKSFFPARFTVEEACYASIVELVKIAIITVPVPVVIAACLCLLHYFHKEP